MSMSRGTKAIFNIEVSSNRYAEHSIILVTIRLFNKWIVYEHKEVFYDDI